MKIVHPILLQGYCFFEKTEWVIAFLLLLTLISCKDNGVKPTDDVVYFKVSGVITCNDSPVASVKVISGNRFSFTDVAGFYQLDSLSGRNSKISFYKDSLFLADTAISVNKNVVLSYDLQNALSQQNEKVELTGKLTAAGINIQNCTVQLSGEVANTDENGNFSFRNALKGMQKLLILLNDKTLVDTLIFLHASTTRNFDLSYLITTKFPKFSINGTYTCNGFPQRFVLVSSGDIITQTDTLGRFSLNGINFGQSVIRFDKEPFPIKDTVIQITGNQNLNISITDNLIKSDSYFPIHLGKTFRFLYTWSTFYGVGGGSYSGSNQYVWSVITVKGSREFPEYTIHEKIFEESGLFLKENIFTVYKTVGDSIRIGESLIWKVLPAVPRTIPVGTDSSPLKLEFYESDGYESRNAVFQRSIGLSRASRSHSGITYGYYYEVSFVESSSPPDGLINSPDVKKSGKAVR